MFLYRFFSGVILSVAALMSGCSATEQAPKNDTDQTLVSISANELAELKLSSQQWQQAKQGIERLLLIEGDLDLLIKQLNAVVKKDHASIVTQPTLNQPEASKPTANKPVVSAPSNSEKPDVGVINANITPLFALQVASVSEYDRLKESLADVKRAAPSLFLGKFDVNSESINVKGSTYYRLKIGAYAYKEQATAGCEKLKNKGINCLVSYFTKNPL